MLFLDLLQPSHFRSLRKRERVCKGVPVFLVYILYMVGEAKVATGTSRNCPGERPSTAPSSNPQLQTLRTVLELNGARNVEHCMERVADLGVSPVGLAQSACMRQVTDIASDAVGTWLTMTGRCQQATVCSSAEQVMTIFSQEPNINATMFRWCQAVLENTTENRSAEVMVLTRSIVRRSLGLVRFRYGSNFSMMEVNTLRGHMLSNLTRAMENIVNKQYIRNTNILLSLVSQLHSITLMLRVQPLTNAPRFMADTVFLICASLFPPSRDADDASSGGTSSLVSSAESPLLDDIKPCHWLCITPIELLSLVAAGSTSTGRSSLCQNSDPATLLRTVSSCGARNAQQCLSLSCQNSSFGQYVCDTSSQMYADSASSSQRLCIRRKDRCHYPLIETTHPSRYADEAKAAAIFLHNLASILSPNVKVTLNASVLPCGKACTGVLFNEDKEAQLRSVAVSMGLLTLSVQVFAILSFSINRNKLNRFPTRFLLYVSICSFVACLSLLGPYVSPAGWRKTVCNDDGTLRENLPSMEEEGSGWCTLTAAALMFSFASTLVWWICLAHAWHTSFQALGRLQQQPLLVKDRHRRLRIIYHAVAWGYSLGITAVFLAVGKVTSLPMFGTCYSIAENTWFGFVTIPTLAWGVVASPFLVKGLYELRKTDGRMSKMKKHRQAGGLRDEYHIHLRRFQVRLAFIMMISFIHLVVLALVGILRHLQDPKFSEDMERHITCNILACEDQRHMCPPLPQQSLAGFTFALVITYAELMVICTWTATRDNIRAWRQFFRSPLTVLRHGVPLKQVASSPATPRSRPSSTSSNASTSTTMTTTTNRLLSASSRSSFLAEEKAATYVPQSREYTGCLPESVSQSSIDSDRPDDAVFALNKKRSQYYHSHSVNTVLTCVSETSLADDLNVSEDVFVAPEHEEISSDL